MAKKVPTPEPETPPKDESATPVPAPRNRGWNMGNIFWGLLFVLIGTLFLLENFNVVDVDFTRLWRLWPLLIIAAGVSVLSVKGWIGTLISGVVVAGMLGLIALTALGTFDLGTAKDIQTETVNIKQDTKPVKTVRLKVEAGAGQITMRSHPEAEAVKAHLESNITTLHHTSQVDGDVQNVSLSTDGKRHWWVGDYRNDLTASLTEQTPVELKVDAGASKVDLDFSNVQLRSLRLDAGASSVDVKVGNKLKVVDLYFDVGMSSVTLRLPEDTGVRFEMDSGMSGKELPGLTHLGDNVHQSSDYDKATHKVVIRGDMGMSSFNLRYY